MNKKTLNKKEILNFKSQAHHLHPIVIIGQKGLTDAVIHETDTALRAHELIKIRIFSNERAERNLISENLCRAVHAQLIQHIGKLLVLYRKNEEQQQ